MTPAVRVPVCLLPSDFCLSVRLASMKKMRDRLALHTWTLDTTPLPDALRAAKSAGWNAVELRRIDFTRCFERGMANAQVLDLVKGSGLAVACVGTEYGLIFAQGEERARLLKVLEETCANAQALGCGLVLAIYSGVVLQHGQAFASDEAFWAYELRRDPEQPYAVERSSAVAAQAGKHARALELALVGERLARRTGRPTRCPTAAPGPAAGQFG